MEYTDRRTNTRMDGQYLQCSLSRRPIIAAKHLLTEINFNTACYKFRETPYPSSSVSMTSWTGLWPRDPVVCADDATSSNTDADVFPISDTTRLGTGISEQQTSAVHSNEILLNTHDRFTIQLEQYHHNEILLTTSFNANETAQPLRMRTNLNWCKQILADFLQYQVSTDGDSTSYIISCKTRLLWNWRHACMQSAKATIRSIN